MLDQLDALESTVTESASAQRASADTDAGAEHKRSTPMSSAAAGAAAALRTTRGLRADLVRIMIVAADSNTCELDTPDAGAPDTGAADDIESWVLSISRGSDETSVAADRAAQLSGDDA